MLRWEESHVGRPAVLSPGKGVDGGQLCVSLGNGNADVIKGHAADRGGRLATVEVRFGLGTVSSKHRSKHRGEWLNSMSAERYCQMGDEGT